MHGQAVALQEGYSARLISAFVDTGTPATEVSSLLCPSCGTTESKVVDSRSSDDGASIRRRRECLACGTRFTTYERLEEMPLIIAKSDGTTEPFDHAKMLRSLLTATIKRDIPLEALDKLVSDVEEGLRDKYRGAAIPSSELGDQVLIRLQDLDKVAYVRFASVYKDFKDLGEFNSELQRLEGVQGA